MGDDWYDDDFPYLQSSQGEKEEGEIEDEAADEVPKVYQHEETTRDDDRVASGPLFQVENWQFVPMPHLGIFSRSGTFYVTDDDDDDFEAMVPALKAEGWVANPQLEKEKDEKGQK